MVETKFVAIGVIGLLSLSLFALIHTEGLSQPEIASNCVSNPQNYAYQEDTTGNLVCNPVDFNLNKGLVGYWPLDEQSGTVAHDVSGSGNNGLLTNFPIWNGQTNCKFNGCLNFSSPSGVNGQYVNVTTFTKLPTGSSGFSVFFWFHPSTVSEYSTMFRFGSASSNQEADMYLDKNNGGRLTFYSTYSVNCGLGSVTAGNWYLFGMTYTSGASQIVCYENSNSNTVSLTGAFNIAYGKFLLADANNGANGLLDDFRVYNYTLSSGQENYLFTHFPYQYPTMNPFNSNQFHTLGLVGYWPFDEGSGTKAYDMTPNLNTGILTNTPKWLTGINCKFGDCLNFTSASNQYVNVPDSPFLHPPTITVSIWVYLYSTSVNGGYSALVNQDALGGNRNWFLDLWGADGHFKWDIFTPTEASVESANVASAKTWYNLIATYDGANMKLYTNGVSATTATTGNLGLAAIATEIGIRNDGALPCSCAIDDVRIYNRALSATEAAALYAEGNGALPNPVYPESQSHLTFVSNTGKTCTDTTHGTKMMGFKLNYTTGTSGQVGITVDFSVHVPSNTSAKSNYKFTYGTGTAPACNAASTGTATGDSHTITGVAAAPTFQQLDLFAKGLSPNTTYWFDLTVTDDGTSSWTYSNPEMIVTELS